MKPIVTSMKSARPEQPVPEGVAMPSAQNVATDPQAGDFNISTDMPAWMAAKKSQAANKDKATAGRKRGLVVVPEDDDENLTHVERAKRWLHSYDAKGYLASAVIHVVLIVGLAFGLMWLERLGIISFSEGGNEFVVNAIVSKDEQNPEDMAWFEIVNTELDKEDGQEMQSPSEMLLEPQMMESEFTRPIQPGELVGLASTGNSQKEGTGDKSANRGFLKPNSGKYVTKGSFTAWTMPEDPAPGQAYNIIIEIKLPEKIRKYKQGDLSGMVIGTDNYRQRIPPSPNSYLRINDHIVQLSVRVPGAEAKVKDIISIESQILEEKQILNIEF